MPVVVLFGGIYDESAFGAGNDLTGGGSGIARISAGIGDIALTAVHESEDFGREGGIGKGNIESLNDILGKILSDDLIFNTEFLFGACGDLSLSGSVACGVKREDSWGRISGNNIDALDIGNSHLHISHSELSILSYQCGMHINAECILMRNAEFVIRNYSGRQCIARMKTQLRIKK